MGRQVEVVIATEAVQGIVGEVPIPTPASTSLQLLPSTCASTSTPPNASTPFILSPLVASRLGTQRSRKPKTNVLGLESIEYWERGAGYNSIQALSREAGLRFSKSP